MTCLVRSVTVRSLADAERELETLRIDPFTIRSLGPKMLYRLVRVEGVSEAEAKSLKKEMHSVGGDAAIGTGTHDGGDHPVVILMGTERQLRRVCSSLGSHPLGFPAIAGELVRLLDKEGAPACSWNTGKRMVDLSRRPCVMGILNVTPDSFSDGNSYFDVDRAVERALQMETEGADMVDIGGESTRPFAPPVSEEEELRRVIPVIERLAGRLTVPISIDTYKAAVAREALAAGAEIVNDVSGLTFDDMMAETVADGKAGLVLMHTRGTPADMQRNTEYHSLIDEIIVYLKAGMARAEAAGIAEDRVVVDPGIGFGKSIQGNLDILARLAEFSVLGRPLLIGTSRKGFIGKTIGRDTGDRLFGTAATVAVAIANGAAIVRVHDVKAMRDVVDVASAIASRLRRCDPME